MRAPVFGKSAGGKFEIGSLALQCMLGFVQDTPKKLEAGGVLLGRHIIGCTDIVVDEITLPINGDYRERRRFFRSRKAHQEVINRAWRESSGTCVYLGEWHTHPEADPEPSPIDVCDRQRRLHRDVVYCDTLYFIIVGTCQLKVWEATRHRLCCTLLGSYTHTEQWHDATFDIASRSMYNGSKPIA